MDFKLMEMKSFAKTLNNLTFTDYFYRLMLIARSRFEWSGLPNGIDEKWIEKYLFSEGSCMFYKDENNGYMVTKCTHEQVNFYDEPVYLRPYGTNLMKYDHLENNKDCVLIRNNDECFPTSITIRLYAWKLADISRTIDTNINMMKMPYIIKTTEKQKNTMKQIVNQRNDNEIVIYADKAMEDNPTEVLKTDAPVVFDKLQIQKHHIWNECMTFLGVNNANMDKRERLVDDEVQANNEQIEACVNVMLKSRELACELINKMFGLNVSVKLRSLEKPILEELDPYGKEGDEDGEI